MCISTSQVNSYHPSHSNFHRQQHSKRPSFPTNRIHRKKLSKQVGEKARLGMLKKEVGMKNLKLYMENKSMIEMGMKNLKLYMENKSMIEENEKLKQKAAFLLQENRALHAQLQNIPHPNCTHMKSS